jgi:hypothetical protein
VIHLKKSKILSSSFYWGDAEGLPHQESVLPSNSSASMATPTLPTSIIATEEMINLQVSFQHSLHFNNTSMFQK